MKPRATEIVARRLGLETRRIIDGSREVRLPTVQDPRAMWIETRSHHLLSLSLRSRVCAAFGAPHEVFTRPDGTVQGVPIFRAPAELEAATAPHHQWILEPATWAASPDAARWVRELDLGPGEAVTCTGLAVSARFRRRTPEGDAERILRFVDSLHLIAIEPGGAAVDPDLTILPESIAAALRQHRGLVELDDDERSQRLSATPVDRLHRLVAQCGPLLPAIDAWLDDAASSDEPRVRELEPLLHALAQATIEAQMLLRG